MQQSRLATPFRLLSVFAALTSLVILSVPQPVAAQQYIITDLGTLPGYTTGSAASGVNNLGEVIGYSWSGEFGGPTHGFLYDGGTMIDIADGYFGSINDAGQAAGWSHLAGGTRRAVRYSNGKITDLGTLGGPESFGYGIDKFGRVVGSAQTASGAWHTFLWSKGKMSDLGTLPGYSSDAYSINAVGQVVGQISSVGPSSPPWRATLWSGGSPIDLGTLGGTISLALRINASGQVVGQAETTSGSEHAVVWTPTTPNVTTFTMTDLGTFAGDEGSIAWGINSAGLVVGSSGNIGTTSWVAEGAHAFIWDKIHGLQDLNDMTPADSGWVLVEADGISDRGQIVGWGTNPQGQTHAYLLTPVNLASLTVNPTTVAGSLSSRRAVRIRVKSTHFSKSAG